MKDTTTKELLEMTDTLNQRGFVEDASRYLKGLAIEGENPTKVLLAIIGTTYGHWVKYNELVELIETSELL